MNVRDIFLACCVVGIAGLWWQGEKRASAIEMQLSTIIEQSSGKSSVTPAQIHALVTSAVEQRQSQEQSSARERLFSGFEAAADQMSGEHRVYGDPEAVITLFEFSDFECPYCKQFHSVPKEIVDRSDGRVKWVLKHFPLDIHNPVAANEAVAAECVGEVAGNRAFWVFADQMFKLTAGNGGGVPGGVESIVNRMGVDGALFSDCVGRQDAYDIVKKQFAAGKKAGVSQTPTTIVVHNKTGAAIAVQGADGDGVMRAIATLVGKGQIGG